MFASAAEEQKEVAFDAGHRPVLRTREIDEVIPGWRERLLVGGERIVVDQYGGSRGTGKNPALVMIDFQHAYLGRDTTIADQIDEFPAGSGERAWHALRTAANVVKSARVAGIPIIYTVVARKNEIQKGGFDDKRRKAVDLTEGSPGTRIPAAIAPDSRDQQYSKPAASIFFGTGIEDYLESNGIDTLLMAGLSTGGCVRASVVDAAARGYSAVVITDAVADRLQFAHEAAFVDIWMKYGDLALSQDVCDFFVARAGADRPTLLGTGH